MADPTEATDDGSQQSGKGLRAQLEAQVAENKTLREQAERAAQLERELSLHRAGLGHLSDKQARALAAAHDGEYTPDALKATAKELGFGASPTGESTPAAAQDPDYSAEAAELAGISGAPDVPAAAGQMTQAEFDKRIAAINSDEELEEFVHANQHIFDNILDRMSHRG